MNVKRERKITFTNVGIVQGSRVWRNSETGVEIIKGKNFSMNGLYFVAVPTLDSRGRYIGTTCTSLATARRMAAIHAEQWRIRIRQAHKEALLEDSDRDGERLMRMRVSRVRDDQRAGSVNPAAGKMTDDEASAYYAALERDRERAREIEARASMNPAWVPPVHYRSPQLGYQACGEMYSSDGLTDVRSEVTCQRCLDRCNSNSGEQPTEGMLRVPAFTRAVA